MISVLLLLAFPFFASADGPDCWNSDRSFYDCGDKGGGGPSGTSTPVISDAVGSNPAAIPLNLTPFGLEAILSDRGGRNGKKKVDVSTVKGFDGIGIGVGSWIENSFSAPDFPAHFLGSSALEAYGNYRNNPPSVLGIRLGSSLLLPRGLMPKGVRVSIGGSLGMGRVSGQWAPQVGALMRILGFSLGYSESFERLSASLPETRITHLSVGFPLAIFYFGYTNATMRSPVNRTFAHLFLLRMTLGQWIAHGGIKVQKDHRGALDEWHRAGLLRRLGKTIGLGYEYGLYRYAHSIVLQIYL